MMNMQQQAVAAGAGMGPGSMGMGINGGMGMGMNSGMACNMSMSMGAQMMTAAGAPAGGGAVVSVSVEGMKFQYQLTEDDLQKVFSRYGTVKDIKVDEVGTTAQITFEQHGHATAAMSELNGKILNGIDGTLRIVPANPGAHHPGQPSISPYAMPPFPGWGFPAGMPPAWTNAQAVAPPLPVGTAPTDMPSLANASSPSPGATLASIGGAPGNDDAKAPAHVKGVRKYTCRFLIGIENDKEFQVVRRIIGAKGTNMKKIVKQTEAKLRLRGTGSGYFEGAGQKESSEPLQLCVSCTSADGYRTAVGLVEGLLDSVYTEYRQFCRDSGRPEPDLHATPQQVSSGRASGGQGGHNDSLTMPVPGQDGGDIVNAAKRDGRRRGRRSRAKKDTSKVERGEPPPRAPPVEEIERLIDQRNEARRQCNFQEADKIRQSLHQRGIALMDEPGARGKGAEVTTWRYWRE